MSRLESIIERLKALPEEQQEAMAQEIETMLEGGASLLTDEQWAEVERELEEDDGVYVPHAEVVERMRARFGR